MLFINAADTRMLLTQIASTIASLLRQTNRFGYILEEPNLALEAAFMDPRYGHLDWLSSPQLIELVQRRYFLLLIYHSKSI